MDMFLDFLFGEKEFKHQAAHEPLTPIKAHSGAESGHDPDQASHLNADHEKLAEIFTAICTAFYSGDMATTVGQMNNFRTEIQAHLESENARLQSFMADTLARDATSPPLIDEFLHELDSIGTAVLAFLGKYSDLDSQPNLTASFGSDLQAVGKVLIERIKREESTLYPPHLPAY